MSDEIAWKTELYRARDECLARLDQPPRPPEVFHYTSPRGIISILESQSVWATHLDYMNDVSELRHTELLFGRVVTNAMKSIGDEPEGVQQLLVWLKEGLSPFGPANAPYAFCACQNGNLLSQWRAYGAGGQGYSIGLDTAKLDLQRDRVVEMTERGMKPIIYSEDAQEAFLKALVERVVALVRARHMEQNDKAARYARMFLMFQFMAWAPSFKNKLFSEEQEWRWITTLQNDAIDLAKIKFREAAHYPTPYVELYQRGNKGRNVALPITRIFTGPGVDHARAEAAIGTIYRKRGEDPPPVEPSRAPLRR